MLAIWHEVVAVRKIFVNASGPETEARAVVVKGQDGRIESSYRGDFGGGEGVKMVSGE